MTIQRFRKVKIDINDKLFSQIVRQGKIRCEKCNNVKALQCCHVFSRGHYNTRFYGRNAVALCSDCHTWFDSNKINACLWDESKRVFTPDEEGYHWLVSIGYTWDELQKMYVKSQMVYTGYSYKKKELTKLLRAELKSLVIKGKVRG